MGPELTEIGLVHSAGPSAAKALYEQNCMQCHGVRGIPPEGLKAALPTVAVFDAAFSPSHTEDSIVKVLAHGKNGGMPSFEGRLTRDQMATLAQYVRGLASK